MYCAMNVKVFKISLITSYVSIKKIFIYFIFKTPKLLNFNATFFKFIIVNSPFYYKPQLPVTINLAFERVQKTHAIILA